MVRCFGLGLALAVLFCGAARAQEADEGATDDGFVFPVYLLAETAASGLVAWRPDWPVDIPVDAFDVLNDMSSRLVAALTLESEGISLSARRDSRGLLSEFPVLLDGVFYQFTTNFDPDGKLRGFTAAGEKPLEILFLAFENSGGEPSLARIHDGESWFFASILYRAALVVETWYDADGNALAVFTAELPDGRPTAFRSVFAAAAMENADPDEPSTPAPSECRLYFDSMGNVTRVDAASGVAEALYDGAGPRYWDAPALGRLALQWDEAGRLVRMAGYAQDGTPLDYRYEYRLDGRGVWTERREFRMTEELGVLIPAPGASFRRTIEYR
ncbi:MAG: hypothetical protein LBO04_05300 [Spirochaetaceae bacterium]|jgi:hypothetical protein|nr:hypothetical protein [Spirochaetaceae bacterium]